MSKVTERQIKRQFEIRGIQWELLRRRKEYQKDYKQYIRLNKSAACKEKIRRKYGITDPLDPALPLPEMPARIKKEFPWFAYFICPKDFFANMDYFCIASLRSGAKPYGDKLAKFLKSTDKSTKEKIRRRIRILSAFGDELRAARSLTPEYRTRFDTGAPEILTSDDLLKIKSAGTIDIRVNIFARKKEIMLAVEGVIDRWQRRLEFGLEKFELAETLRRLTETPFGRIPRETKGARTEKLSYYRCLLKVWDLNKIEELTPKEIFQSRKYYKELRFEKISRPDSIEKCITRCQRLIDGDYRKIK